MYYQEKLEEYERLVQVRDSLQKIQDEIKTDIKNKFNQIAVVEDYEVDEFRYLDEYIKQIRFDGASIKIFMREFENTLNLKELSELFDGELEMIYDERYIDGPALVFVLWDDRDTHYFAQGIVTINQH